MASNFVMGGIVSGTNHLLGFAAVVTAAAASLVHYVAVLTEADQKRVERVTAYGFHIGVVVAAILFILDWILG